MQGTCVHTLVGHEAAVWSVLPLQDGTGLVLTASADRTIKLWSGGECVKTFSGHADVVRTLALVPGVGFLSGSNDGTVRLWDLGGECLRTIQASDTFVYSVNVLESGEWMTCSEDVSRLPLCWNLAVPGARAALRRGWSCCVGD